ncbi:MAG: hypothetical protein WBE41_04745 [Terracidiphilus sp.]
MSDTLTINAATLPPAPVTNNETVTVTDTESFPDVADSEKITVADQCIVRAFTPIVFTPASATFNANDGTGYATHPYTSVDFSATGGIGTLNLTESDALPSGIAFSDGVLSGTPASPRFNRDLCSQNAMNPTLDKGSLECRRWRTGDQWDRYGQKNSGYR